MAHTYRHDLVIDSRDVDGHGQCKASAFLGHLQEAATQAAEHSSFGRDKLLERYNGFWMMTRQWYRLEQPLRWGDEVTIHTWHRGGKGAVSYRDYDIYLRGSLIGEGVAAWVLADMETRRLIRLDRVEEMAETHGGELCKTITLAKLRAPQELEVREQRLMRYSDTDINGHVNNTRYADFACDALGLETMEEGKFLASMQIGYLAECRPGERITLKTGALDEGRYVCGLDEAGKGRFEAALFFGKVLP